MSYKSATHVPDNLKHVLKSEDDIVGIIKMCEPLSSDQCTEI